MNVKSQRGFSMIEVLITIAILMVGLLGLAGLQTRVATAEFEAYQRAQALVIIQDIMDRLNANKKNIGLYVQDNIGSAGTTIACGGKTGAALDLCEINNMLVGAAETSAGGSNLGAMIGARACIAGPVTSTYTVTVAWQGITPTVAPAATCGSGQYGSETLRRTVSVPLRVGCLTCP